MLIGALTVEIISDRTLPLLRVQQHPLGLGCEARVTEQELRALARYLQHEADKLSTKEA
jgi:hypothetical protein